MDGSKKLTVTFGVIAALSTSVAVALALRPAAPPPSPVGRPSAPGGDAYIPSEPRAPGGVNAIAAKALEGGAPRTPNGAAAPGAPRRAVVSFRVPVGASAATAWACIAAAGTHGAQHLDPGGTLDGMADATVAAACTGAGADTLDGFVRLAVAPQKSGGTTCEATVSYTLTRAGAAGPKRDVRSERVDGNVPDNCAASLTALEPLFAQRIAEP